MISHVSYDPPHKALPPPLQIIYVLSYTMICTRISKGFRKECARICSSSGFLFPDRRLLLRLNQLCLWASWSVCKIFQVKDDHKVHYFFLKECFLANSSSHQSICASTCACCCIRFLLSSTNQIPTKQSFLALNFL